MSSIEKDRSRKDRLMSVRISHADHEALQAAAKAYRRRTGQLVTVSDLLRWGLLRSPHRLALRCQRGRRSERGNGSTVLRQSS